MPRYRLIFEFDTEHDGSAVLATQLALSTFDFPKAGYELLREGVRPWQSVAVVASRPAPRRKPAKVRA